MAMASPPPGSQRAQIENARQEAWEKNPLPKAREAARDGGQFNVAGIVSVVFVIIGLIVTVALIDGLDNDYYNQTDNITTSMQNASFSDSTLDSLTDPLGLLVGVVLLLGIVLLILNSVGVV